MDSGQKTIENIFTHCYILSRDIIRKICCTDEINFEILPAMFVICDYSALSAGKDRRMIADRILKKIHDSYFPACNPKDVAKFDSRVLLYGEIIRGKPLRCDFCFGKSEMFEENAILKCVALLLDIITNPKCADDYDNAPLSLYDITNSIDIMSDIAVPLYEALANLFVDISDLPNLNQVEHKTEKQPSRENTNDTVYVESSLSKIEAINDFDNNEYYKKCDNRNVETFSTKTSTGKHSLFSKKDLKRHFSLSNLIITILSTLLVVSVFFCIYQHSTISSQKVALKKKNSSIQLLNNRLDSVKNKISAYDNLISALNKSNLGYASNNFHSSEGVIVVSKNQKNRKFTLTAHWPNGGTVTTDYYPRLLNSADVSFDNDNWSTSTSMTINPNREGITTVTFSNDIDNRTFDVVIVVTE